MHKHLASFLLAGLPFAFVACGAPEPQAEDDSPFTFTRPRLDPGAQCRLLNPGYISLDGVSGVPSHASGNANYIIYGEPLNVVALATAHEVYSGSGSFTFDHPIVLDGVTLQVPFPRSYGFGHEVQTSLLLTGPTVSGATPDLHTVSLTSVCGTETKQLATTRIFGHAPSPLLTASQTYINSGDAVALSATRTGDAATCSFSRMHLVGTQDYDGKVVLDETPAGTVLSWDRIVHPTISTTYTLTAYCSLATYATPQITARKVQVAPAPPAPLCGGGPVQTWQFCLTCQSVFGGEPSYQSTIIETACSYEAAQQDAQRMATNCSLTDGACN